MKKLDSSVVIVTTTINPPTKALTRFMAMPWDLLVVGDKKTPHEDYDGLDCVYLHPDQQEKLYPELSANIGWNTIQRRNIGFIEAYKSGANWIVTVDDDNIPYDCWNSTVQLALSNRLIECDTYVHSSDFIADPLSATNQSDIWHRGFPIQNVPLKNFIAYRGKRHVFPKVICSLWDGDPDIDAICRITKAPEVRFNTETPFCFPHNRVPFNSQNTIVHRSVLKNYMMMPHVGRMDDIFGAYYLQSKEDVIPIFTKATVYQSRNPHDLSKDLEKEMIGYTRGLTVAENPDTIITLDERLADFIRLYQENFK